MAQHGFEVVFLLAGAFRGAIDALHTELARQGHPEARPLHGFALQAIGQDGVTVSELGRRLGVSKQAAAKTARTLEEIGYAARTADPNDARATRLTHTARGEDLLRRSAVIFERQADQWRSEVGAARYEAMAEALAVIGGDTRFGDFPGWLTG